jgi:hypothetical protein
MDKFEKVEIDLSSSEELQVRLDAYRRRARDLSAFVKSQQWGIHNVHVDRSDQERPKISGSQPDELVLEALYRRFRFFILEHEKANYYRFIRLLSALCKDEMLHKFLRLERKGFYKEHSLEFAFITASTKYRSNEVIDFWFNAYYFHDQPIDRVKLATFESIVSSEGAKVILWRCVWHSVRKVRNLAWLTRETTLQNPIVYVPVSREKLH